jgi:hypothetical protein
MNEEYDQELEDLPPFDEHTSGDADRDAELEYMYDNH